MFEDADQKQCYDNCCKLFTLKWVDVCRSRLVCRGIKTAKNKYDLLGPERCVFTDAAVGGVEDAGVHDDHENHTD